MQPDYKMTTLLLTGNHVSHTPAEMHGMLTGQLCSGVTSPDPEHIAELLEDMPNLTPVVKKLIERLEVETVEQLSSLDYKFHPLLPADDSDLQERVTALGVWCDAFTVGFAAGFIKPASELSPEALEILNDFSQLANVSDSADEVSDQDEVDYMELVEYVRVASLTLFQMFSISAAGLASGEVPPSGTDPDPGFIH